MNLYIEDTNEIEMRANQEDEIRLQAGDTIDLGSNDYNDLTNKPSIEGVELVGDVSLDDLGAAHAEDIPTDVSELNNDAGYITASDIPPEVTDLGNIDPSDYDDDLEEFLNTLTESGNYKFVWEDGDDFEYFVEIQSLVDSGNGELLQHYWYTEEGAKFQYNRCATFEDGECVDSDYFDYITSADANIAFAPKSHSHYENVSKAKTVWDYCDDELGFDNGKPYIIYADKLNSKNWLIERYSAMRSPNQRFLRLYDLGDASHFYLRSGLYSAGVITWGSWKEYPSGGGGGGSSVFIAEYGVTSYQDILTALEEGKAVVCKYEMKMGGQTVMTAYFSNIVDYIAYQQIVFAAVLNDQTLTLTVDSSDTWADMWGTNVTDVKVNGSSILSQGVASLSNVAVSGSYNDLGDKPEQTEEVTVSTSGDVTYSLEANKIYHFTGQISSLTLTLVATSLIPHYHFDFVSGTTPATISFGSSINWLGGEGLTPQPSMHYEVDILNGRGIFAEFPAR